MPYIDSNIFLYPILYADETTVKVENVKQILQNIENGELIACTSTLTWDEVVWVVSKVMGKAEGISQGQKLLGFPNLVFISADVDVLTHAQAIIDKHNLSPRDSIHIASALKRKEKIFYSDDKDFDNITEVKRVPIE